MYRVGYLVWSHRDKSAAWQIRVHNFMTQCSSTATSLFLIIFYLFWFQEAKKLGVHRTVHAGENGPAENVKVVSLHISMCSILSWMLWCSLLAGLGADVCGADRAWLLRSVGRGVVSSNGATSLPLRSVPHLQHDNWRCTCWLRCTSAAQVVNTVQSCLQIVNTPINYE